MRIRAGFEIVYECAAPTPMVLMLSLRPERSPDLETPQRIVAAPAVDTHQYKDGFGNICTRLLAPAGRIALTSDFVVRDHGQPDPAVVGAVQHPVEALPDDTLVFLMGSRYCDPSPFLDLAWREFGQAAPGWARVQAIVDYVHDRITFGYEHASVFRTAYGAHEERFGVCRDYAHLAVTLCRAMSIPARYCTGYLGDIGTPPADAPMDFSAWFQVFLGGKWRTFDARHNRPRVGRLMMAYGRDATDVAIATTFGAAELVGFTVVTEELAEMRAAASGG
jgi:transglutaminase-like putative cysteine protease